MSYQIALDDRSYPDARIDVIGGSVILHSRGGSTGGRPPRNVGYSDALFAICRRAQADAGVLERVLIDSTIARRLPEADRVILSKDEIRLLGGDGLASTIQFRALRFGQVEGTKGGNATKRLRFDFSLTPPAIIRSLGLREWEFSFDVPAAARVARLDAEELSQVTPLHIRQAVDRLLAGQDAPNFPESRDYDVLVPSGERLAPKKVFGLAIEQALGIEAFPGHLNAGWSQHCFEIIQRAGFTIVDKSVPGAPSEAGRPPLPPDPDEQTWAEGNPLFAQHLRTERQRSRKAAAAKRTQVRADNQGRLVCENPACNADWYALFEVPIAEAVFEIHHVIPVSTMQQDHQTVLGDLLCLCAACHRAEHRRLTLESSLELIDRILRPSPSRP